MRQTRADELSCRLREMSSSGRSRRGGGGGIECEYLVEFALEDDEAGAVGGVGLDVVGDAGVQRVDQVLDRLDVLALAPQRRAVAPGAAGQGQRQGYAEHQHRQPAPRAHGGVMCCV